MSHWTMVQSGSDFKDWVIEVATSCQKKKKKQQLYCIKIQDFIKNVLCTNMIKYSHYFKNYINIFSKFF